MILAAIGDNLYNVFLLVHVLTAVVALGPVLAHSVARSEESPLTVKSIRQVYGPALVVSGLLGFGLAGLSKSGDLLVYKMSQPWLMIAFIVWVVMNGVLHGMVVPAARAVADGEPTARSRVDTGTAIVSVLLVVMLWTMIFKPGL